MEHNALLNTKAAVATRRDVNAAAFAYADFTKII